MLDDPQSCLDLKIQLEAVVDVGVHFVKATYHLEGDGPLIFSVYSTLQEVASACASAESTLPNVSAIAREKAGENTSLSAAELLQRGKDCTRPAIHWYLRKFNVEFCYAITAFKHA